MKKIKIFVDGHVFDGFHQGTVTYIKGIYNELVTYANFEISIASNNLENLKKQFTHPDFKFIKLENTGSIKRLLFEIPKILEKQKFDFAHFQYICPIQKKCKYIVTIHDLLFIDFPQFFSLKERIKYNTFFYLSSLKADLVCTVSDYSYEAIIKNYKISTEKLIITHNGIDSPELYDLVNIKEKYSLKKYILYVSRIEPRKNHISLIKAFIDLKLIEKGYSLVCIGKNQVRVPELESYLQNLDTSLRRQILFLENIPRNELSSFLSQADLFVYPSYAEGFGIPPLEAAMHSCKVISSRNTAMSEYDFFGKYLFDPGDISDLKSKLLDALSDNSYPFEEIKNKIQLKYNWSSITNRFVKRLIYEYEK